MIKTKTDHVASQPTEYQAPKSSNTEQKGLHSSPLEIKSKELSLLPSPSSLAPVPPELLEIQEPEDIFEPRPEDPVHQNFSKWLDDKKIKELTGEELPLSQVPQGLFNPALPKVVFERALDKIMASVSNVPQDQKEEMVGFLTEARKKQGITPDMIDALQKREKENFNQKAQITLLKELNKLGVLSQIPRASTEVKAGNTTLGQVEHYRILDDGKSEKGKSEAAISGNGANVAFFTDKEDPGLSRHGKIKDENTWKAIQNKVDEDFADQKDNIQNGKTLAPAIHHYDLKTDLWGGRRGA